MVPLKAQYRRQGTMGGQDNGTDRAWSMEGRGGLLLDEIT